MDKQKQTLIKNYLAGTYRPLIKNKYSSVTSATPAQIVLYLNKKRKTYPYFLKFDLEKFYVDIKHDILIDTIKKCFALRGKPIGKQGHKYINIIQKDFLPSSPFDNQSLAVGSTLSHTLSSIYMLDLDMAIKNPYTRFVDDYVVLFKSKAQIDTFISDVLLPALGRLKLNLNPKKLSSGKFATDACVYLGFKFIRGIIAIDKQSIVKFKEKIKHITSLSNKNDKNIVQKLNYKIDGFGHYYKLSACVGVFDELDKYIRHRLRFYLNRSKSVEVNFLQSNKDFDELGLHRLSYINKKQKQNTHCVKKYQQAGAVGLMQKIDRLDERLARIENLLNMTRLVVPCYFLSFRA